MDKNLDKYIEQACKLKENADVKHIFATDYNFYIKGKEYITWAKDCLCYLNKNYMGSFINIFMEIVSAKSISTETMDGLIGILLSLKEKSLLQQSIKDKLFISHSSQDEKIVRQIETFLGKLGVKQELIFCSSLEGQGVKNGERIEERIRNELINSKLILFVISQNFMDSKYCVQELGAGWILRAKNEAKTFIIRLHDINFEEIRGFTNSDFKASEINDFSLNDFIDDLRELYDLSNAKATENAKVKKSFLQAIEPLLA